MQPCAMRTRLAILGLALVVGIGGSVAFISTTPAASAVGPAVAALARVAGDPAKLVSTTGRLVDAALAIAGAEISGTLNPAALDAAAARRVLGKDGRLTVLLLGSDARPGLGGLRTDAMMVASVDPATGRTAIISIPRDIVRFPLTATRRFPGKINAIYQSLGWSSRTPGTTLRQMVGQALGIEIDAYVIVGFEAFQRLVWRVGGLDVTVARSFYDRYYSVTPRKRGWGLKAGPHHLDARNALIFARTRKADNDYARARRQQQLVIAAVKKVRALGPDIVPGLLAIARGSYKTDLPLADRDLLFAVVARADLAHVKQTVFGPSAFASWQYGAGYVLKLAAVRAWVRTYFPKARPGGIWLPPVAAPVVAPVPTPSPTPSPTPWPSPSPSVDPTLSPTPSPTPDPTPAPTP